LSKDFFYTGVSIGSRLLAGMLLFVVLARVLGPSSFGTFAFSFALATFLALIVDFGFPTYLMREISAEPDRAARLVNEAYGTKLVLVIVFVSIGAASAWYIDDGAAWRVMAPLMLAVVLLSFADFFIAPLRALGHYAKEAMIVASCNTLHFVVCTATALSNGGVELIAWSFVLTRAGYLMAAFIGLRRIVPSLALCLPNLAVLRKMFLRIRAYAADTALMTTYAQVDVLAVKFLFGTSGVGLYVAGQKLAQGAAMLAPVIGNVAIPAMTRATKLGPAVWGEKASKTFLITSLIGLLLGLPFVFLASELVGVLYGESFKQLEALLPYFGLLIFLRYVAASSGILLTSIGRQLTRVRGQCIALLVFVGIVALAPYFDAPIEIVPIAHCAAFAVLGMLYWLSLKNSKWPIRLGKVETLSMIAAGMMLLIVVIVK